ncbi:putative extracellular sulfatase Sulf-1 homolog isoform X2 [Haliotis cracherodii]|uniref:putative extracellular sulfatase Sulf-1 homolog isoform X2 n=1 Tax=Haliotis cracherodii TaxID=6455 RepID=UPI0039EA1952
MRANLLHFGLTLIVFYTLAEANNRFHDNNKPFHRIPRHRRNKSEKPNIVIVLTDDQDLLLGSLDVMPKLNRLIRNQGAFFNYSFSSTPMCCPSRSSILTGMYTHNHNVYTNNDNCSSIQWQQTHETRTFATYLNDRGYRTGYFGKYLNEYNGTYIPPGWKEWVGLIRNSRYYNYSINFNGRKIKHQDNYYSDYLTDLIANDSVTFLKQSKQYYPTRPVLMVLSVPAPHGPEDAAPQYQHMFKNSTSHRTPSWNFAPNPDKQWLLQYTASMTPLYRHFTDMLQRKRLQTLQSVDDLVEKVYNELKMLGELDNTYIIYTSDHGYHLGQYGLVKGKAMPYDFDIRIPMIMRGPGIMPRTVINNPVATVDLAPTILDIAGVPTPEQMDGRSMLRLLRMAKDQLLEANGGFVPMKRPWRDTILIERGKVTKKQMTMLIREEKKDFWSGYTKDKEQYHYYLNGRLRKLRDCSKPDFQRPCKANQKWYCEQTPSGIPRKHKCRGENQVQSDQAFGCNCAGRKKKLKQERKNQRRFLKAHLNKPYRPKFLRSKRSVSDFDTMNNSPAVDLQSKIGFNLFDRRCRMLDNGTISCDQQLYQDPGALQDHKEKIEEMIKEYRKALEDLRVIRRHLKQQRPDDLSMFDLNMSGPLLSETINMEDDCDCEDDVISSSKTSGRFNQKDDRSSKKMKKRKRQRKRKKNVNCNSPNMKCFTHDNNHWQTPPKWNSQRKWKRFNHESCRKEGMECALMDTHHWKTAPFWKLGPFCFCPNANNNTYWCLRTVNMTHNFLYCEFITRFFSFYDFNKDPYQLENSVAKLNFGVLQQLHEDLKHLKACSGRNCDTRSRKGGNDGKAHDLLGSGDGDTTSQKPDQSTRQKLRSSIGSNVTQVSTKRRDAYMDT